MYTQQEKRHLSICFFKLSLQNKQNSKTVDSAKNARENLFNPKKFNFFGKI